MTADWLLNLWTADREYFPHVTPVIMILLKILKKYWMKCKVLKTGKLISSLFYAIMMKTERNILTEGFTEIYWMRIKVSKALVMILFSFLKGTTKPSPRWNLRIKTRSATEKKHWICSWIFWMLNQVKVKIKVAEYLWFLLLTSIFTFTSTLANLNPDS